MTNVSESGPEHADPTAASAVRASAAGVSAAGVSAAAVEVRIRRAPKISVFLILGALVGFLGTLILTALQPVDPAIGFAALFGYFLVYGIPAGVVVGGIIGVIFEWTSYRAAKIVPAERLVAEETEEPEEPEAATERPELPEVAAAQPELTDQPHGLS
ncbi:hypothetical protein [Parafrigoribacterium humi]|jgi:hypothetical protein|uniref:hypothetical protein n=1 Tax=Parafrigoribacterium humi TaxID=3144664 RepID=UPI0032EB428B